MRNGREEGNDLNGGAANSDTIRSGGGNDEIRGGPGLRAQQAAIPTAPKWAPPAATKVYIQRQTWDVYQNYEKLCVIDGSGNVSKNDKPDIIEGGADNDLILAHPDNDYVGGSDDDDAINGLARNDYLLGSKGNDTELELSSKDQPFGSGITLVTLARFNCVDLSWETKRFKRSANDHNWRTFA